MTTPAGAGQPVDRILIVDDDVALCESLALACTEAGYESVTAGTAAAALAAAEASSFAAILLDVNLPDRDGFHVLETLRRMDAHVGTAVILITGHQGAGWAERALALEATDFLTKPIRFEDLVLRLKLVTRVHRSHETVVRRRLERALAEAESKYGAIFAQSADVILVARGLTIVDANAAAERILGRPREALLRETLLSLSPPVQPDGQRTEALLERLHGSRAPSLWCVRQGGGAIVQLEASIQDFELESLAGYQLVTARDVTKQRRLEAELSRAQRFEAIGLLAGGVAHDFNNILTVIGGYVDLAHARALKVKDEEIAVELQQIRKSADRAGSLTRQLLDFGRARPGERTAVNLDHLIERCRDLLARLLREDVRFVVRLDARSARVLADPSRLEQVLMNLVVNARDAMPDGGELVIATQQVLLAPHDAEREKLAAGSYVLLSVKDNGVGMADSVKVRIFDPFFTTKARNEGTGLGLSIVLAIVEELGGKIALDTYPGEGSTFWVYLPVSVAPEAAVATPGPFRTGSELILLAEDDPMVRAVETAMLETFGHRVIACGTGAEASAAFRAHKGEIAVVISDYIMPDEKGVDLERRLRELDPAVKFIIVSGHALGGDVRPSANTLVLEKPVTLHALSAALKRILG